MSMSHARFVIPLAMLGSLPAMPAAALLPAVYSFSTGDPDGLIATAARPESTGKFEIESADDFVLTNTTSITSATFTGLVPAGSSATGVVVEIYRVFPTDSDVGRTSGSPTFSTDQVPTRVNSPSDIALDERDAAIGQFSTTVLNAELYREQLGDAGRYQSQTEPNHRRRRSGHGRGSAVLGKLRDAFRPPGRPLFLRAPGPAGQRRLPLVVGAETGDPIPARLYRPAKLDPIDFPQHT